MGSNKGSASWLNALTIGGGTFFLALAIGYGSQAFLGRIASLILSFALLILIIFIGILFDIIGVAVAAADEAPLHARAAKKINGARQAVWLLRHADQVASFCTDVVGDVCSTLSGAIGAAIIFRLLGHAVDKDILISTLMTAMVSATAVGGKAAGKRFALTEADTIVFFVGRILAAAEKITGLKLFQNSGRKGKRA
ncbi:MAG: hypothetical protein PWP65_481 [Clostridia bacterium]|nr:hypothetical protein [Clostridia bacterium]